MATILLVEENTRLARFTALSVERLLDGVKVVVANDCDEARLLAREYMPDVLITDQFLPDGDGLLLQQELRTHRPEMLAILVSADHDAFSEDREAVAQVFRALEKPCDTRTLVQAISAALSVPRSKMPASRVADPRQKKRPEQRYRQLNQLATLLTQLRLLEVDLLAAAGDPVGTKNILAEQIEAIVETIRHLEVSIRSESDA